MSSLSKADKRDSREVLVFFDDKILRRSADEENTFQLEPASAKSGSSPFGSTPMPTADVAMTKYSIIPKTTIFILSNGRSGSQFFSSFFMRKEFRNVMCKGHLWPFFLETNVLYSEGVLTREKAIGAILEHKAEITLFAHEVFVCVSHDCWALVELLSEVFPNSKFIYVSRDPRDLLVSSASLTSTVQSVVGKSYLEPTNLSLHGKHTPKNGSWLERECYFWSHCAKSYYDQFVQLNERGLIVKFEDIFDPGKGFPGMRKISGFVEDVLRIPTNESWLKSAMESKANTQEYSFPQWDMWKDDDKYILTQHCGETMELLGYDL